MAKAKAKPAAAAAKKKGKIDPAAKERLAAANDFLEEHARTCLATVETWMLRSLLED